MAQLSELPEPPELLPFLGTATDPVQLRVEALNAAFRLHEMVGGLRAHAGAERADTVAEAENAIRATADLFAAWLAGTVRLRLTAGPPTDQTTGAPTGAAIPEGATMAQLHDNETFTVTADTEDAKGYDTAESIEWSIDNADVASLTVSEDTKSVDVIAGAPGSAVLTANIPALGLSATLAVDVVPAGTATIELAVGDVSEQ